MSHPLIAKYQIPILNDQNRFGILVIVICLLFEIWDLEFFGARPGGLHSANIADQGHMVREFDLWYLKIGGLYFRAVKNIIQLSSRCPAGVRRLSLAIGTL